MEPELGDDPFLGHGRITVTDMHVKTPSINAVPDEALIYIDRRITFGEDPQAELERIRRIIGDRRDIEASILFYDDPSYTGFVFPVDKIFPAWALPEDDAIVQAGVRGGRSAVGRTAAHRQMGFLDQRHLLGGQGRHSEHRLWPRQRNPRAYGDRPGAAGRCGARPSGTRCCRIRR